MFVMGLSLLENEAIFVCRRGFRDDFRLGFIPASTNLPGDESHRSPV